MKKGKLRGLRRKILVSIEKARIKGVTADIKSISRELELGESLIEEELTNLMREKFVLSRNGAFFLTDKGRRSVRIGVIGGVFDIIHVGHIATLIEAKKNCDLLAVIVARDKTVLRKKGKKPINDEGKRVAIVESMKPVDVAVLGDEKDFRKPLSIISPDIIFLGHDQSLPEEIEEPPGRIQVKRLKVFVKGESTSNLVSQLEEYVKGSLRGR